MLRRARKDVGMKQRGFSVLVLALVLAMMAVGGYVIADVTGLELMIVGEHRKTVEAMNLADAALMEVIHANADN